MAESSDYLSKANGFQKLVIKSFTEIRDSQQLKQEVSSYNQDAASYALGADYVAFINPASISHGYSIEYNAEQTTGSTQSAQRFKNASPEKLSFELTFDGTGVAGKAINVDEEIEKFLEVTYKCRGESHEPPFVLIMWGSSVSFHGRLKSVDVKHTLFKPDGSSLRAKLNVSFESSMDQATEANEKKRSSPDLSHIRVVKEGDTLPMLCQDIYKDSSRYLQVAKINNLFDFRDLEPGMEIMFPPIV